MTKRYKSEALAAAHETALGLTEGRGHVEADHEGVR